MLKLHTYDYILAYIVLFVLLLLLLLLLLLSLLTGLQTGSGHAGVVAEVLQDDINIILYMYTHKYIILHHIINITYVA